MAQATNYNTVRNAEDVLDIVTVVDPENTPMFSTLAKSRVPHNELQEFQADSLKDPEFDGVIDGTDVNAYENKSENRVVLSNRVQIFRETGQVSRLQEATKTYGVPSELAYQKSRAFVDIKNAGESALGSDNDAQLGSGIQPPKLRGLGKWIDATNTDIPASVRTPTNSIGTTSTLTEESFNTVLQSTFEAAGKSQDFRLFCGPTLQNKISRFLRAEGTTTATPFTVNMDQMSKTVSLTVTRFVSDFGTVTTVPDLFLGRVSDGGITTQSRERGYLVNPSIVSLGMMQNPLLTEAPDLGGGRRFLLEMVMTLVVKNPKGLAKFA